MRPRRLLGAAASGVLLLGIVPTLSQAAPGAAPPSGKAPAKSAIPGFYDARRDPAIRGMLGNRSAMLAAKPSTAVADLRGQLGDQGIVDLDPLTGTPRQVARLDGFLTGPSRSPALKIAKDYIRANRALFGVDIDALKLRQDYVDIEGTHHLSFQQLVGGVPVFGNGLKADVAGNGQLIQVTGAPVSQLPAGLGPAKLTAAQARDAAVLDAKGTSKTSVKTQSAAAEKATTFASGDKAQLVAFQTAGGTRLAWQVITRKEGYLHVLDAQTGRVLFRQSLVQHDRGPDALVWTNYPGAPRGGQQRLTSLGRWVSRDATTLTGNSSHVFLDVNDNNVADPGEEVALGRYPLKDFTAQVGGLCSAQYQCTWDPTVPFSWQDNANMDATQLLYFTSVFHDHLKAAPIGFTRAAGNFETADGDQVEVNDLDGANLDNGFPDLDHVDNANMSTPPDGMPPTMQMYLQPAPNDPSDPYVPSDVGNEASSVYHEYTHGLSNRLVIDADGVSTLNGPQSGAMGEAWSDWYAYDYLEKEGLEKDTKKPGELVIFEYSTAGANTIRSQPLDCTVGAPAAVCPGRPKAGPGGYTYGDMGKISSRGPEVHADGEIWAETLWDLRTALGYRLSESLVTRAMELAPADPSYLDMRNSILQADLVVDHGNRQKDIWKVFANRGMGFFAATVDGSDTQPVEDFSLPPGKSTPRGTLTGTVTDTDSGRPVAGAAVAFGGHSSGFAGSYAAVTDTSGRYQIKNVFVGTYQKVSAGGAGFERQVKTVTIAKGTNTVNWSIRRDWAAAQGGASIVDANGDDFSIFGCGPSAVIDLSQGTGWSTDAAYTSATAIDPRFVIVQLPAAVNLSQVTVNPTGNCGDDPSASTGDYRVETSPDGSTWTVAANGHFGVANRDTMNTVPLTAGSTSGVRFLRYTMLGTQVAEEGGTCPGGLSGCDFVDTVEIAVYGAPA